MKTIHRVYHGKAGRFRPVRRFTRASWAVLLSFSIAISTLLPVSSFAAGPGTTSGDLLKVPVSARAIGMGEAYTALANDSSALDWNPAGMSFMQQKEAAFMHSSLYEGIHYERLAFAAPGDSYSYGASMSYLGYGSMEGFDNNGIPIGDQSAYSYLLTGGLASMVHDRLSLGVTASYLRQKLADTSAGTAVFNTGILYELASRPWGGAYRLGFSALNLGPGLEFVSESNPLPRKYRFGASALHLKDLPLNLAADVLMPNDNSTTFSMGSEYWFKEMIALRLGYAGSRDEGSGLRLGFGFRHRDILFDYAFSDQGDLGSAHRFEMMFRWGDRMHPLNREQRAILKEAKRAGTEQDFVQEILTLNEILNTDPTNDRILRKMILAHEAMLKNELQDVMTADGRPAPPEEEIPSPEEFALQDMVPGQQAIVSNTVPANFDPADPLGLGNLPDTLSHQAPAATPGVVSAPSAVPAVEKAAASFDADISAGPESDGILLKPSDIYN